MYRDEIKNWQGLLSHLLYKSLEFFLISAAIYLAIRCIGIYPVDNDIANCAGKTWWATLCNTVIRLFIIGSGLAYIWYVYCKYEIKGEIAKTNNVLITACGVLLMYWWENPTNMCIPLVAAAILLLTFYYIQESHLESKKRNSSPPKFKSCFGPELDNSPDRLGRELLYQRTIQQIRKAYSTQKEGNVIGIFGQWGSGKTHLLNHIERELAKKISEEEGLYNVSFKSYNINLWQINDTEELWKVFRKTLEKAYHIPNKGGIEQLFAIIIDFLAGINVRGIIEKTIYNEIDLENDEYNDTLIEQLRDKADHDNILLFLDNVERANPDIIHELLPLVQRLKRLPNLVIILSASLDDIASITGSKTENISQIRGHIFKLVSSIVHIPPPNEEEANVLFAELAEEVQNKKGGFPTYLYDYALEKILSFDNARQIFRVVQQLESFEDIYFSELSSAHTDKTVEYSAEHVYLAFSVELIRSFFPDAYFVMQTFEHIWSRNKKLPNLHEFFICHTRELQMPQATDRNGNLKIEAMFLRERSVDNDSIKTSLWSKHENYVGSRLFRSILYFLQNTNSNDFTYAINMDYVSRNQFPPSSCAATALIFSDTKQTDIAHFIKSKISAVYRPSVEKTKMDILNYSRAFLRDNPNHTDREAYVRTLLAIYATCPAKQFTHWNEPIKDDYETPFNEFDYLDIFIQTNNSNNSTFSSGFKSLLARADFPLIAKFALHFCHASNTSFDFDAFSFGKETKERYETIHQMFVSKKCNPAARTLYREYVKRILIEIISRKGNVRVMRDFNAQNLYTSYDFTDDASIHSYLADGIIDLLNIYSSLPPHDLLFYYLKYFSIVRIPHIRTDKSLIDVIGYSSISHKIYKPVREFISNNIGSISSRDSNFIRTINEFSQNVQNDIDILLSDHVSADNKYLAGLCQLKEWVDSFNIAD